MIGFVNFFESKKNTQCKAKEKWIFGYAINTITLSPCFDKPFEGLKSCKNNVQTTGAQSDGILANRININRKEKKIFFFEGCHWYQFN
ncbi:MAG: hypothetical protein HY960_14155 [Ignavibacteriae bacterium]|nr:hypothetical protein [Ignavibacteriota bacterium]